jgi:hypothetical protein
MVERKARAENNSMYIMVSCAFLGADLGMMALYHHQQL